MVGSGYDIFKDLFYIYNQIEKQVIILNKRYFKYVFNSKLAPKGRIL